MYALFILHIRAIDNSPTIDQDTGRKTGPSSRQGGRLN